MRFAFVPVLLAILLVAVGCNGAEDVNAPPSVGFDYTPKSPTAGTPVEFVAQATDPEPDGRVVSYAWEFGDGGEASGRTPMHTYETPGRYEVTVTLTDTGGRTDAASETVEVE